MVIKARNRKIPSMKLAITYKMGQDAYYEYGVGYGSAVTGIASHIYNNY